jgi:hypothetical protein
MKRSFLSIALAGAMGLGMLASASSASAVCTQLASKNFAIRLVGAQIDSGSASDPAPNPIAAVGIIAVSASPACTITGKIIYNDGGTFTAPTTSPYAQFNGSDNLSGSVSLSATQNEGTMTLVQSGGGLGTGNFAIYAETGNAEFRGARIDSSADPLGITGEHQVAIAAPVAPATISAAFITNAAFSFEGGAAEPGNILGFGEGAVAGDVDANLDPSGSGVADAGGSLVYNNDGGTINGSTPFGPFPCDFDQAYVDTNDTLGYEETSATFNGDFGCPLATAADQTSSVIWGTSNQNAFIITTGANGAPFAAVSTGVASKTTQFHVAISPGAATVHSTGAPVTLTVTDGLGKPFDYSSIALSGSLTGFVTDSTSTCSTSGGDVAATNPMAPGANTCTIVLINSGTPCAAAGPDHVTGTVSIVGGTNTVTPSSTIAVTCTH